MTRKYFGTDGIRGIANTEPMTADTAMKVAMAAAGLFRRGDYKHRVVIGKDTRLSGYLLEPALTSGFIAKGMDVILLGPVPTPAVSMLTKSLRADMGVMISASHNPYQDNGIKLFGPDGLKLSDELEKSIEERMEGDLSADNVLSSELGRASRLEDAVGRYVEYAKATFNGARLDGLKIVVDCANGAAYKVAPEVFWELGAEVILLSAAPNGKNINHNCGATATKAMQEAVVANNADLGIALDGDADRLIMADETGRKLDGDQLIALVAKHWAKQNKLKNNSVVVTQMSNMGLGKLLSSIGVKLYKTAVGDRYVVEKMREIGANLGGEQSGHLIFSDYACTGDGIIAALQVLSIVRNSQEKLSTACNVFEPIPQVMKSIAADRSILEQKTVQAAIDAAKKRLGDKGEISVRASGTEKLIRVMAQGEDEKQISMAVDEICAVIKA
ncbi:MAG: phosphoglucosamine mutase [Alphaproteobacteria bacterium]|nr:phosphoglucosamine mutase [Alphaproteobacteria bacterium]MCL2505254.1 phosphoglucosamine mutase [Alphaproteobacteria bacterium]